MQKYERLYFYIQEYQKLVYDYYSKDGIAFLVTYYNINSSETVWEDQNLMDGAYETVGEYSGIKWDKISLLPVYFIEEISTAFSGDETGYIKENETNIVIPSSYGITPLPRDIIKLEQSYMRPINDTYPLYIVTNAEISADTDKRFWKLNLKIFQSKTTEELDAQVENNLVFYDYDKKIHYVEDAQFLTKMLYKNNLLQKELKNLYDENSGFYLI